uniref:Cryptochrome DASH n=1 Tax=Helicotheca tamesis TaxID=374047 RepID=A0A7S2MZZ4_9STRA
MKAASSSSKKTMFIHWFRHGDLRLHDNPALTHTIDLAKNQSNNNAEEEGIVPMFCFDPRVFGNSATSEFGSLKCGSRRAQFVIDSVADLRKSLEEKGSGLLVAHGKPEDVFESMFEGMEEKVIPKIVCQEEVASEEKKVNKKVKSVLKRLEQNSAMDYVWGSTMYDPDSLPFQDGLYGMPDTFTPFRNKVEKKCTIGHPLPSPSKSQLAMSGTLKSKLPDTKSCSLTYLPTLSELGYTPEQIKEAEYDSRSVMAFKGGESAALARVKDYIWDKDLLKTYFDTRNGMLGADYSTKFSPWLAHGCVSPRYVATQCQKYEKERVQNKSTYWVVFELLWRDFFKFFAVKHGNAIFFLDGTLGKKAHGEHPNSRRWSLDKRHLQAWKEGKTGYPLVDANMRELAASGFMSNRGRQNVCSFLSIDMKTDWRYGADHFEQELLDYDIYSNWGNWCAGAGMTGGRLNRFNIVKQSKDYDQNGDYVKCWCPELKDVPIEFVHEPWKMSKEQQIEYECVLGVDYPNPVVPPSKPTYRSNDGGGRGGGKGKGGRGQNKRGGGGGRGGGNKDNKNRIKSQRKDMKSLKEGTYRFG